jgi:hypothetical protein
MQHTWSIGSNPTYQNCTPLPSPPDAMGWKLGFASQLAIYENIISNQRIYMKENLPPQDQLKVVAELQYAEAAKNVNGLSVKSCAADSVWKDCSSG